MIDIKLRRDELTHKTEDTGLPLSLQEFLHEVLGRLDVFLLAGDGDEDLGVALVVHPGQAQWIVFEFCGLVTNSWAPFKTNWGFQQSLCETTDNGTHT